MKRFASIFVAALICIAGLAQPKSLGLRLTSGAEISYQHNVGENFMEFDLGFNYATGVGLTASYDFVIDNPEWSPRGTWEVYAGPGLSLGSFLRETPLTFGICGNFGVSYTFWFPLQLSIESRPAIGFATTPEGFMYNVKGLLGFVPTIGVKYSFGQK